MRRAGVALAFAAAGVGRLGSTVKSDREAVSGVFARLLSTLPATYAERENIDEIPATTDGLLALGRFLDEQAKEVATRYDEIEKVDAEIDRLAWRLYRPQKTAKESADD